MNLTLFKKKSFTLYVAGKFVSLIGSNMLQFAISLYVLSITGSAVIFASMLSVLIVPRLLLTPIAGVFGDWFDRKKSVVLLDFINSFIIGMYFILFLSTGKITIPLLYLFVILLEITELFFHSSMSAILPSIVEKDRLVEANAINSLVNNIGQLLAPILGAILYGAFGLKIILLVSTISFCFSAISEIFMEVPKTHKEPEKISFSIFKTDLNEGIKVIKENRFISSIIGIGTIVNFFIGPLFSIGLIFVLKEVLKVSDYSYGMFQTVLAISMLVAPILAAPIIKKTPIGKLSFLSLFIVGILIAVMSFGPSRILINLSGGTIIPFIFILIISFLIGVSVTILNIATGTLFNQIVPLELMGRVSSVLGLAVTVFIPIGQMIFGFLYDIIDSEYVILLSGLIILLSVFGYRNILYRIDKEQDIENTSESHIENTLEEGVTDEVSVL